MVEEEEVSIYGSTLEQVTSNGSEASVVDQEDVTVSGDSTTRDELASAAVKLQKLYKGYQSFSLIYNDRSVDLICKDKDEAKVWFSGLKALISRGHHRKWRNEFRSDGIPSKANKPRTYTRRRSPLHSPFTSNDSLQKAREEMFRERLCYLEAMLGVIKAVRNSLDSSEEVTALWVTHCLEELEYADGALYMEDGRVVKHGDAKTILEFIKGRQSAYIKQINS
ncbi:hypothetical protein CsatB_003248 [Cannabis sativa]